MLVASCKETLFPSKHLNNVNGGQGRLEIDPWITESMEIEDMDTGETCIKHLINSSKNLLFKLSTLL